MVEDIIRHNLIDAPLAQIRYPDNSVGYIIAAEGMTVGASLDRSIQSLGKIKEGTQIFGIETAPHSGPKLVRSPGVAATLMSKTKKQAVVQLPSKKTKVLHLNCRATVGVPAGDGRTEKPMVKAGSKWHAMHARGKLYPRTSGKRMNIVDHPFGGSGHGTVRKPVSRHAPPGRKIGNVSPRKTGKKKR